MSWRSLSQSQKLLDNTLANASRRYSVSEISKAPEGLELIEVNGTLYPKPRIDRIYQKASVPKEPFQTSLPHYRVDQPELNTNTQAPVEIGFLTERVSRQTGEPRFSYEDPADGDAVLTSPRQTVQLLKEINDYMHSPGGRGLHNFYPTSDQKGRIYKKYLNSTNVEDISPEGFDVRNPSQYTGESGYEQVLDTRRTYGAPGLMQRVYEIGDQQRAMDELTGNAGLLKALYPQGVEPVHTYMNAPTLKDLPVPALPPRRRI